MHPICVCVWYASIDHRKCHTNHKRYNSKRNKKFTTHNMQKWSKGNVSIVHIRGRCNISLFIAFYREKKKQYKPCFICCHIVSLAILFRDFQISRYDSNIKCRQIDNQGSNKYKKYPIFDRMYAVSTHQFNHRRNNKNDPKLDENSIFRYGFHRWQHTKCRHTKDKDPSSNYTYRPAPYL